MRGAPGAVAGRRTSRPLIAASASASGAAGIFNASQRIEDVVGAAIERIAAGDDPTVDLPAAPGLCSRGPGGGFTAAR